MTAVARRFVTSNWWPADFRLIVSPLATWIWIGAIITFCGGLIAPWPAPGDRAAACERPRRGARGARACAVLVLMEALVVIAVVLAVAAFVSVPLRRRREEEQAAETAALRPELADLEAAKEAKYREIRDAELDHRTGKLSAEDYAVVDRALRAEAVALLKRIDAIRSSVFPPPFRRSRLRSASHVHDPRPPSKSP